MQARQIQAERGECADGGRPRWVAQPALLIHSTARTLSLRPIAHTADAVYTCLIPIRSAKGSSYMQHSACPTLLGFRFWSRSGSPVSQSWRLWHIRLFIVLRPEEDAMSVSARTVIDRLGRRRRRKQVYRLPSMGQWHTKSTDIISPRQGGADRVSTCRVLPDSDLDDSPGP